MTKHREAIRLTKIALFLCGIFFGKKRQKKKIRGIKKRGTNWGCSVFASVWSIVSQGIVGERFRVRLFETGLAVLPFSLSIRR